MTKTPNRKISVAAKLKRAGHMSQKRFTHFKAITKGKAKRKKEDWL